MTSASFEALKPISIEFKSIQLRAVIKHDKPIEIYMKREFAPRERCFVCIQFSNALDVNSRLIHTKTNRTPVCNAHLFEFYLKKKHFVMQFLKLFNWINARQL